MGCLEPSQGTEQGDQGLGAQTSEKPPTEIGDPGALPSVFPATCCDNRAPVSAASLLEIPNPVASTCMQRVLVSRGHVDHLVWRVQPRT